MKNGTAAIEAVMRRLSPEDLTWMQEHPNHRLTFLVRANQDAALSCPTDSRAQVLLMQAIIDLQRVRISCMGMRDLTLYAEPLVV